MSKSKCGFVKWITKCEKSSCGKGMVGFLIKKRFAKSKEGANFELVIISAIFFTLSRLIFVI